MSSMKTIMEMTKRRPARRLGSRLSFVLAAALLGTAACEGDNLFTGTGRLGDGPPVIASLTVPVSVAEGAVLDVRAKAVAPQGLASVTIRFRRGAVGEQQFPGTSQSDTVTVDATITVPSQSQDSVVVVEAFATDTRGRVSEIVTRTVRVIDASAPTVTVTADPQQVSIGDTLRIRVNASDRFGLQSIGFALVTANGDTLQGSPFLTQVSGVSRDTVFRFVIPQNMQPSQLRLIALAVNSSQLRGVSAPVQITLVDRFAPVVNILSPLAGDSYPLGDSILVRVNVSDSAGVAEVRLEGIGIRRDSLQNTVVVQSYLPKVVPFPQPPNGQSPRDTTVQRFLLPGTTQIVDEVYIIATARDGTGNVRADTVRIIDGPSIRLPDLVSGSTVSINSTLLVRVTAVDRLAGLDSLRLAATGVVQDTIRLVNLGGRATLDTTLALPLGPTQGPLALRPLVWNRAGIRGAGPVTSLTVGPTGASDVTAPRVGRAVTAASRVELNDSILVSVQATDGTGSGVRRMGIVVIATPDSVGLPTRTFYLASPTFNPPLTGTPRRDFQFSLADQYSALETRLPRKFTLQVHAFAVDAAGNCGASVTVDLAALACSATTVNGQQFYTAQGAAPAQLQVTAVAGSSVVMPGGGTIADALVDPARRRIYMSNISSNRVEIFNLSAGSFELTGPAACTQTGCRGAVGAAPWGLFINNRGDSLIVANSGGTNISFLPLDGANFMVEDVQRRLLTPNINLFDVRGTITNGVLRFTTTIHDFSDRPQFVAQHATGTLLFSTRPTSAAQPGTIRFADTNPNPAATDDLPESYILFTGNAWTPTEDAYALANVDSVRIVRADGEDDRIIIYDHVPGYYAQPGRTAQVIQSQALPVNEAVNQARGLGSDVEVFPGVWNVPALALADTTFVAASTDRTTIAFGEGDRAPFGRIFLCCDIQTGPPLRVGISGSLQVADLVNNAAERVFGLGLNANGSLGVARGLNAAYYFSRDLRLQGEFRSGIAGGSGGAALHPQHASVLETGDAALSFVATANRTIKIIDTAHFFERGEIHIRDNVVGPLRATMPSDADNQGMSPADPNYVVIKLVAVTENNNVVVVDVRRKDIR